MTRKTPEHERDERDVQGMYTRIIPEIVLVKYDDDMLPIDHRMILVASDDQVGVLEVRGKGHKMGKYPDTFISKHKMEALDAAAALGLYAIYCNVWQHADVRFIRVQDIYRGDLRLVEPRDGRASESAYYFDIEDMVDIYDLRDLHLSGPHPELGG